MELHTTGKIMNPYYMMEVILEKKKNSNSLTFLDKMLNIFFQLLVDKYYKQLWSARSQIESLAKICREKTELKFINPTWLTNVLSDPYDYF